MDARAITGAPRRAIAVAIGLAVAVLMALSITSAAEAHTSLPRFKSNGYMCHRHTKPVRMNHKGQVWPKRGTKSRTHCIKPRPKRVRHQSHGGGSGAWVLPAYVVRCESGGNPRAVNYSNPNRPAGLYQIITSTWLGYGGGRFAPTADRATVYEQGVIARAVIRGQGMGAWECA